MTGIRNLVRFGNPPKVTNPSILLISRWFEYFCQDGCCSDGKLGKL